MNIEEYEDLVIKVITFEEEDIVTASPLDDDDDEGAHVVH